MHCQTGSLWAVQCTYRRCRSMRNVGASTAVQTLMPRAVRRVASCALKQAATVEHFFSAESPPRNDLRTIGPERVVKPAWRMGAGSPTSLVTGTSHSSPRPFCTVAACREASQNCGWRSTCLLKFSGFHARTKASGIVRRMCSLRMYRQSFPRPFIAWPGGG